MPPVKPPAAPPHPEFQTIGQLPARVQTVGTFMGSINRSVIQMYSEGLDAYYSRRTALTVVDQNGKMPSTVATLGIDIPSSLTGGGPQELGVKITVPKLYLEPDQMPGFTKLTADWNLTVHSQAVDDRLLKGHETLDETVHIGWGVFTSQTHVTADASESDERKRTTDDTATMSCHAEWGMIPVSQGMADLMAMERRALKSGMRIVEGLYQAKEEELKRKVGVAVPAADGSQLKPDPKPLPKLADTVTGAKDTGSSGGDSGGGSDTGSSGDSGDDSGPPVDDGGDDA